MRFHDTSRIRTRFDERLTTADGTELSVDLYLPPTPGRYPALLHRTASDNNRDGRVGVSSPPAERWKIMAAKGYIVATVDVRGRGDSDGSFIPFVNEGTDGAAAVAWLRAHKECSGKIGALGSGYGAFCAWAAAIADGNIDAIVSISPFGAVGSGFVHRGGAMRLDWLFWMHLIAGRTLQPANVPPWPRIHRHLPMGTLDEALGRSDIWWKEWVEHADPADPYWASADLVSRISALRVPGLHVTGWWDGQVNAAYSYYAAAARSGVPQELVVGPWDTAAVRRPTSQVGGVDFGPRSVIDLDETVLDFLDRWLVGPASSGHSSSRIFITGRNEWVVDESASRFTTEMSRLYLYSELGANTRLGDGELLSIPSQRATKSVITHNPSVPVEFQPRFVSFAAAANPLGFTLNQGHLTARDEALVYTSQPLRAPITVYGRPKIVLTVCTDAPDADLFVLLSDSFPLGIRDLHLSHTAVRLRTIEVFRPGDPITLELEFDPVAHDFLEGHQIRVTVTPSLFPLYARNLHGCDYVMGREATVAEIELHCGADAPSQLLLPMTVKS